jgi:hypothetical protein
MEQALGALIRIGFVRDDRKLSLRQRQRRVRAAGEG